MEDLCKLAYQPHQIWMSDCSMETRYLNICFIPCFLSKFSNLNATGTFPITATTHLFVCYFPTKAVHSILKGRTIVNT